MNSIDTKDVDRIISLYLDGELDGEDARVFEEYLASHPSVAREVGVLRRAKKVLKGKKQIPRNDWFWLKLSNIIDRKERRSKKFPARLRPAVSFAAVATVTLSLIGIVYLKDASVFNSFFIDKKNQLQNTLMQGNILPFFSNLNKDDVLNFALFGNLSLDSANGTALTVKNDEHDGAQIEIVRERSGREMPPVTVNEFYKNVGLHTAHERQFVDSILETYTRKLQASVLVSENNEIAINEQLVDMNRAMVSSIAASLQPTQRVRLQRLLQERHAPYAVVSVSEPKLEPHELQQRIPTLHAGNRYVVISKDTIGFAEMNMDMESINARLRQHAFAEQRLMTEKMFSEIVEMQRQFENNIVITGSDNNRIRVYSTDKAFQINLQPTGPAPSNRGISEVVRPRITRPSFPRREMNDVIVIGDSAFTFELSADDDALRAFRRLPRGEFRFELPDSAARAPKVKIMFKSAPSQKEFDAVLQEMKQREEELIDLDSLLQENKKNEDALRPKRNDDDGRILDL
ncbi:MAG: anti-sigma factor family protein [Bacteroidota bacterium]